MDKSQYDSGLDNAADSAKVFGTKLKRGMAIAAGAVTAVAGAASATAAVMAKEAGAVASYGDQVDKASQKLGISAEAYQEWDAVLKHSGTSIDSMGVGMKTLATKAASGSDAFEKLGISAQRAASMSREDLFAETITALQNVSDENERAMLAQELFGRSAMELGPLLNTSAEETQAMKDRVHELGGVMSDEAVKAAAKYQDTLQDMQTAFSGLKRGLVSEFLPSLTTVMEGITELFSGGGTEKISEGMNQFIDKISEVIPKVLDVGADIVMKLADSIIKNLPKLVQSATKTIITLVNGIVKELPTIVKAGLDMLLALARGIAENLPQLVPTIVEVVMEIVDILTQPDTLDALLDAALQIILALAEGLINATPELIDRVPLIIGNLVEALIKNAPRMLEAGGQLILMLGKGIIDTVGNVFKSIGEIGRTISDAFINIGNAAWDWGKDMMLNLWEGIKAFINKPIDAVKGLAKKIWSFLGFSEPKEGPLSNFHTYAPDMMKLFAQGIEDNKHLITDAIGDSFNLSPTVNATMGGQEFTVPRAGGTGKMMTVILQIRDTEIGRALVPILDAEKQRYGVQLATGGAY